jgi:hypothetical protein
MFGEHIVVTGAICKCSFGKTPDVLFALKNMSIHANDTTGPPKFMACTADIMRPFLLNSFGLCSKLYNIPCTVMVTEWQNSSTQIMLEEGPVLLESSSATCAFGMPGCITIVHHGQLMELSASHFDNADTESSRLFNPAVDLRDVYDDPGTPDGIDIL